MPLPGLGPSETDTSTNQATGAHALWKEQALPCIGLAAPTAPRTSACGAQ